jgi:hypothetical protein
MGPSNDPTGADPIIEKVEAMLAIQRSQTTDLAAILEALKGRAIGSPRLLGREDLKARGYGRYAIDNAIEAGELQPGPEGPRGALRVYESEFERWEASKPYKRKPRKVKDALWADEDAEGRAQLSRLAAGGSR